ncbi:MAG: CRISPR-associated endonuclease Cas2 [Dehalococcoidales bacterium]|nr:CRISPR-associated endonuclease Cas2 [Dehalococcoidales bacterium]
MKLLLIYDIVEDKIRNKLADICLDYGLDSCGLRVLALEATR